MSEENVEIVRRPISVQPDSRRRLEERLALRFPRLLAFAVHAAQRLPTRSGLRQRIVHRLVRLGTEAVNRGDYDAAFAFHHPDCEATFPAQMTTLGDEPGTLGRNRRIAFQRKWHAEWGAIRFEPEELVDLNDRLLLIGRVEGRGLSSGAAFGNEWAVLFTVPDGLVTREQVFLDHAEALEAAGMSE